MKQKKNIIDINYNAFKSYSLKIFESPVYLCGAKGEVKVKVNFAGDTVVRINVGQCQRTVYRSLHVYASILFISRKR